MMELHEAIKTIISQFGIDILSDRKFINALQDYYHFDVPAKKRIVASLIEEGHLTKLTKCGDVFLEINNISNYEFRTNGFNENLTKDILMEFAKGLGVIKNKPSQKKEKVEINSDTSSLIIRASDVINIVYLEDISKGNYNTKKISSSVLDVISLIIDKKIHCLDGDKYVLNGDYSKAFEIYSHFSKDEDLCSLRLAFCYLLGEGTTKDYSKAEHILKKLSDLDAIAQYGLGLLYEMRHTTDADYIASVKWYMKSIEKNFSPALTNLGICYYWGKGVVVDYKEAVKWFKKAIKQDNPYAQAYLGICYLNGLGVRKNVSEAVWLFMKSSDQHNLLGEYYMGQCYEKGIGVMQSKDEAIKLYKASAAQGYEEA